MPINVTRILQAEQQRDGHEKGYSSLSALAASAAASKASRDGTPKDGTPQP